MYPHNQGWAQQSSTDGLCAQTLELIFLVCISTLPFMGCVTLDKLLNLSVL